MDASLLGSILTVTVAAGASLLYAAIGEIITERSGVLNLGLEPRLVETGAVERLLAAVESGKRREQVAVGRNAILEAELSGLEVARHERGSREQKEARQRRADDKGPPERSPGLTDQPHLESSLLTAGSGNVRARRRSVFAT